MPSHLYRPIVFVDLFTKKISNQNLSPNFTGLNNLHLVKAKLLLFFIVISGPILGQKELKKELFPIGETQTGFRKQFVYKRQLIDNPLALQIPLLEAQDPVVSREFLIYKRQQSNIKWISGLTTLLSFYTLLNKIENKLKEYIYINYIMEPIVKTSKNYSVGMTSAKARQVTPGKPKNYRRSQ